MVVRYFGKRVRGIRWRALISTEIGFYRALGGAAIDARRGNESFTLFGVREPGSMTLPPGIQLLGLGLLGAFETIVGLDEEKPGALLVAHRACLIQILFRFAT